MLLSRASRIWLFAATFFALAIGSEYQPWKGREVSIPEPIVAPIPAPGQWVGLDNVSKSLRGAEGRPLQMAVEIGGEFSGNAHEGLLLTIPCRLRLTADLAARDALLDLPDLSNGRYDAARNITFWVSPEVGPPKQTERIYLHNLGCRPGHSFAGGLASVRAVPWE